MHHVRPVMYSGPELSTIRLQFRRGTPRLGRPSLGSILNQLDDLQQRETTNSQPCQPHG